MEKQAHKQARDNLPSVYASSCLSWETGLWQATAWRRVPTCGTFGHQCIAHVKGFKSSAEAERAALTRATQRGE